jgi:hypothetical protein
LKQRGITAENPSQAAHHHDVKQPYQSLVQTTQRRRWGLSLFMLCLVNFQLLVLCVSRLSGLSTMTIMLHNNTSASIGRGP